MGGNAKPTAGVLALQGDFGAHQRALERAGAESILVKDRDALNSADALIIPGGESTTMLKLLRETGLFTPVREFAQKKPVFGTCAGAILMANEVANPQQDSLKLFDMAVERNAYGRQLDSRIARIEMENGDLEAVFIRAPIIRRVGEGVRVLASYNGDPVLVEEGRHLAATFHPELTEDSRIHRLFLEKIAGRL